MLHASLHFSIALSWRLCGFRTCRVDWPLGVSPETCRRIGWSLCMPRTCLFGYGHGQTFDSLHMIDWVGDYTPGRKRFHNSRFCRICLQALSGGWGIGLCKLHERGFCFSASCMPTCCHVPTDRIRRVCHCLPCWHRACSEVPLHFYGAVYTVRFLERVAADTWKQVFWQRKVRSSFVCDPCGLHQRMPHCKSVA